MKLLEKPCCLNMLVRVFAVWQVDNATFGVAEYPFASQSI